MDSILKLDGTVFYFLNHHIHNAFLDTIMPWITELGSGGMVWLFVMFVLAVFGKGPGRKAAFLGTVALVTSWLLSDMALKPLFARPRPFIHFPDTRLLVAGPEQFSFPSGHTTTGFASAVALLRKNKGIGIPALALAALIGISRVYVGVHYPLDVFGGLLLGSIVGYLVVQFESPLDKLAVSLKTLVRRKRTQ